MKDILRYCRTCEYNNGTVKIHKGHIYPCEYGRFVMTYLKRIENYHQNIEEITETCVLQKRIIDFEMLDERCYHFVENMIESKNREDEHQDIGIKQEL